MPEIVHHDADILKTLNARFTATAKRIHHVISVGRYSFESLSIGPRSYSLRTDQEKLLTELGFQNGLFRRR